MTSDARGAVQLTKVMFEPVTGLICKALVAKTRDQSPAQL